ncbi:MAG: hypothetical protein AVDCRST_MAG85-2397, partial [uncultured Solirubrobacteraceae bacterium]
ALQRRPHRAQRPPAPGRARPAAGHDRQPRRRGARRPGPVVRARGRRRHRPPGRRVRPGDALL